MKFQADQHIREVENQVGEWVFVRLQPYRQTILKLQKTTKLSPKYYGPYQITHKPESALPTIFAIGGIIQSLPNAIIEVRQEQKSNRLYWVRWEDKETAQTTWVRGSWLHKYLPNVIIDLEDKVTLEGEGIVMNECY